MLRREADGIRGEGRKQISIRMSYGSPKNLVTQELGLSEVWLGNSDGLLKR